MCTGAMTDEMQWADRSAVLNKEIDESTETKLFTKPTS